MRFLHAAILIGVGCISSLVVADEGNGVNTSLLEATKKIDGDSAIASSLFIQYLGAVHGDSSSEQELFSACIEQLRRSGNGENLKSLEYLLNSSRYLSQPNSYTRRLITEMRPLASEAWYDIKWESATEPVKVETALYGCHPSPSVHVDVDVSVKRLMSLGDKGRAPFVAMLMNPELTYERSLWVTLASSAAASLISPGPFDVTDDYWALTAAEQDAIIQKGGSYGKAVVIRSLLRAKDVRGIEAMVEWVKAFRDDPWAVNSLLQHVSGLNGSDATTAHKYAQALITFGEQALKELASNNNTQPDTEWAASLYLVNQKLTSLRSVEGVRNYFDGYRRQRQELDMAFLEQASDQYRNSVEGSLKYADRFASMVE